MTKQKKIASILFSVALIAVLAGVLAVTIWRPKETSSYFENRDYAEWPSATAENTANGEYFTDLETALCDYAAFRTTLLKVKTWADMELLQKPVVNDVVVTDDEVLLSYREYEAVDNSAIEQEAEEMAQSLQLLSETVEDYGGTFLYVAVPSQYAYFEDRYPSYLNNRAEYTEAETTAFFPALEKYGVHYLDIGAVWASEGNPVEYMSSVDHHYTWAGCYSAYRAVMAELNALTGEDLIVLTDDDLELNTLPNPYLGSYARKLCGLWKSSESLVYATLKEEISFARYDWGNDTPGASSTLAFPATNWEDEFYTFYMGGDVSETIIETEREGLPNLLVYGDSFTNEMETILYASFDKTVSLDLRSYSEMSLLDYVSDYQPEIVICIRDYEQLLSQEGNGAVQ